MYHHRTPARTCMIVFTVSTGTSRILNAPARTLAPAVLTNAGKEAVCSKESINASAPALLAVSPNRDSGAWISAGPRPLHAAREYIESKEGVSKHGRYATARYLKRLQISVLW